VIAPFQLDDALLDDIRGAATAGHDFHLWWLGQSGFLLKWRGKFVLFDPYLSDSLTRKYAGTTREHVRLTARCIDPARLDMISLVTSSHNHTDHLDAETLLPLAHANPGLRLILPEANIEFARQRLAGADITMIGLDSGASVDVDEFRFTGVPAAHNEVDRDNRGRCLYLGFIVGFGPWAIYHSGDTMWHGELERILRVHSPDVVLLPINGHKPERGVAGNLSGLEAATLARACRARLVVPHHFEMFAFNTESPDEFIAECRRLGQPHRVLRCGERLSLDSPSSFRAAGSP
jgi:L-ascorbate metabolism protein UlaG (beta-lactamase superfamily)